MQQMKSTAVNLFQTQQIVCRGNNRKDKIFKSISLAILFNCKEEQNNNTSISKYQLENEINKENCKEEDERWIETERVLKVIIKNL